MQKCNCKNSTQTLGKTGVSTFESRSFQHDPPLRLLRFIPAALWSTARSGCPIFGKWMSMGDWILVSSFVSLSMAQDLGVNIGCSWCCFCSEDSDVEYLTPAGGLYQWNHFSVATILWSWSCKTHAYRYLWPAHVSYSMYVFYECK